MSHESSARIGDATTQHTVASTQHFFLLLICAIYLVVAALFAVHPLHVETVAWISQRKDVMSTLFWWLTLWQYQRWVTTPSRARYALVLALFACGLMSKPIVIMLPVTLLLLDYWPLGRVSEGAPSWPQWRRTPARCSKTWA